MFIIMFPRVKNKISCAVMWAVIIAFFALAQPVVENLQPKFDPNHFKPVEIAQVATTAQKELYSGDFSFKVEKWGKDVKGPFNSIITYNKAKDETVIEVKPDGDAYDLLKQFDKGNADVLPGKYTFKGNVLIKSEVDSKLCGNRTLGGAGIAELTGILPSNLFFKRILDDKDRLRYLPMEDVVDERLWKEYENRVFIRTPLGAYSGTSKKALSLTFVKSGDGYKLLRKKDYPPFLITPYWVKYNEANKK
ncbi:MAG: hypothetical protein FWF63_07760 [Fibromonadales bacterium]|nr:hypothetical protein [Fibromonadales bacterium]